MVPGVGTGTGTSPDTAFKFFTSDFICKDLLYEIEHMNFLFEYLPVNHTRLFMNPLPLLLGA